MKTREEERQREKKKGGVDIVPENSPATAANATIARMVRDMLVMFPPAIERGGSFGREEKGGGARRFGR